MSAVGMWLLVFVLTIATGWVVIDVAEGKQPWQNAACLLVLTLLAMTAEAVVVR